jgi:hypothetical protein
MNKVGVSPEMASKTSTEHFLPGFLDPIDYFVAVSIAALTLYEKFLNNQFLPVQRFFRKLWILVRRSSWKQLPIRVIEIAFDILKPINKFFERLLLKRSYFFIGEVLLVALIVRTGLYAKGSIHIAIFILLLLILTIRGLWFLKPSYEAYSEDSRIKSYNNRHPEFYTEIENYELSFFDKKISLTCDQVATLEAWLLLANVLCDCFFLYLIITMGLPASLNEASINLFLLAPFATTLLFYIFQLTSIAIVGSYVTKFFSFPLTFSGALVSVFVTILAAYIGVLIEAPISSPLTYWLITVNFVFDAVTVFTTLIVIMFINEDKTFFKAVLAIIADLILAAVFACLTLYLSLFFTPHKITLLEAFH